MSPYVLVLVGILYPGSEQAGAPTLQQVGSPGVSSIEFQSLDACRAAASAIVTSAGWVSFSAPGMFGWGPRVSASCISRKTGKAAKWWSEH